MVRNREQGPQIGLGRLRDRDELLAAMTHLHHGLAAAVPVVHLLGGLLEDLLGQDRRTGAEVVHP